jgi:hypothetical protein
MRVQCSYGRCEYPFGIRPFRSSNSVGYADDVSLWLAEAEMIRGLVCFARGNVRVCGDFHAHTPGNGRVTRACMRILENAISNPDEYYETKV